MEARTVVVERSPIAEALDDFCLMLLAILFPPAAVLIRAGCGGSFCLNILLTLLGWLPGCIHAFFVIATYPPEPVYVAELPGAPVVIVQQQPPAPPSHQGTPRAHYGTNMESQPFYSPGGHYHSKPPQPPQPTLYGQYAQYGGQPSYSAGAPPQQQPYFPPPQGDAPPSYGTS